MLAEKQVYKLRYELKRTVFTFRDPFIEVFLKDNQTISMDDYFEGLELIRSVRPNGRFCFLYVLGDFSQISSELRNFAASSKANKHTIADAVVINSLSQRIMANFYIRFNKPIRPTKVFTDRKLAEEWLQSFSN